MSAKDPIRKRADGYWEARYTYKDELGASKRKSVYAKTRKECRQKLTAALYAVDNGTYRQSKNYTLSQWLEEWLTTYCIDLKPATISSYRGKMNARIIPYIGTVQLKSLNNIKIQKFYNTLQAGDKTHKPLSAKSIQTIHGIVHKSLEQAVAAGVLTTNPADHVKLPKVKKPDLQPLMDEDIGRFLNAIKEDRFEYLFTVDLFSGLRQSELLGLQWDDVDLENGLLHIHRQIQKAHDKDEYIFLDETKNGKQRTASIAPSIVSILRKQMVRQKEWQLAAGELWNNEHNLVFTDETGGHLKHHTVYNHFKAVVASLGLPATRFHDLRHSYAINALQAGDNVKAVQEQLGHYSSAFTMDTYADVSNTMRRESQNRMEALIQSVSNL